MAIQGDPVYAVFHFGGPRVYRREQFASRLAACEELLRRGAERKSNGEMILYASHTTAFPTETVHTLDLRKELRVPGTSVIRHIDGSTSFDPSEFTEYHVTGLDVHGHRFRTVYRRSGWAFGINLYSGTVWGVLPSGRRVRLKRV